MHGEKKECPISRCFSGATGKRTVRNEKQMVSNAEEQWLCQPAPGVCIWSLINDTEISSPSWGLEIASAFGSTSLAVTRVIVWFRLFHELVNMSVLAMILVGTKLCVHVPVTNKSQVHDEKQMSKRTLVGGISCRYGFLIRKWHKMLWHVHEGPDVIRGGGRILGLGTSRRWIEQCSFWVVT